MLKFFLFSPLGIGCFKFLFSFDNVFNWGNQPSFLTLKASNYSFIVFQKSLSWDSNPRPPDLSCQSIHAIDSSATEVSAKGRSCRTLCGRILLRIVLTPKLPPQKRNGNARFWNPRPWACIERYGALDLTTTMAR